MALSQTQIDQLNAAYLKPNKTATDQANIDYAMKTYGWKPTQPVVVQPTITPQQAVNPYPKAPTNPLVNYNYSSGSGYAGGGGSSWGSTPAVVNPYPNAPTNPYLQTSYNPMGTPAPKTTTAQSLQTSTQTAQKTLTPEQKAQLDLAYNRPGGQTATDKANIAYAMKNFGYTAPITNMPTIPTGTEGNVNAATINATEINKPQLNIGTNGTKNSMTDFLASLTASKAAQDQYMAGLASTADVEKAKAEQQAYRDKLNNLLDQNTGRGQAIIDAEAQAKIPEQQTQLNELNLQIAQRRGEFEKAAGSIENINATGLSTTIGGVAGNIRRQEAVEIGALTGVAQVMQGNIDLARQTVSRAVELQYEDIQQKITNTLAQLEMNSQDLTRAEQKQAEDKKEYLAYQQQALDDAKEEKTNIFNLALNAAQNGAGNDVINQIIKSGDYASALQVAAGNNNPIANEVANAISEGYTAKDIVDYMAQTQGSDMADNIAAARAQGSSDEEIMQALATMSGDNFLSTQTAGKRDTSVQIVNGRSLLIDMQTGEAIADLGDVGSDGLPKPINKGTQDNPDWGYWDVNNNWTPVSGGTTSPTANASTISVINMIDNLLSNNGVSGLVGSNWLGRLSVPGLQGKIQEAKGLIAQLTDTNTINSLSGSAKTALQSFAILIKSAQDKKGTIKMSQGTFETALSNLKTQLQGFNNAPSMALNGLLSIPDGASGGQCGRFVNKLTGLGVGDSYQSKMSKMSIKNPTANQLQPGMVFVTPYKDTGHIGFIVAVNNDGTVTVKDSNYHLNEKIDTHKIKISSITGATFA